MAAKPWRHTFALTDQPEPAANSMQTKFPTIKRDIQLGPSVQQDIDQRDAAVIMAAVIRNAAGSQSPHDMAAISAELLRALQAELRKP